MTINQADSKSNPNDLLSGWLVVTHTCVYYSPLSFYRTRRFVELLVVRCR